MVAENWDRCVSRPARQLQRRLTAVLTHLVATNDGVRVIRTRAVIR